MKNVRQFILWCVLLTCVAGSAQNDTVVFSAKGGFYEDVFALQLYNVNLQNHIRYTVNGNRPTKHSPLYTEALALDEPLYSKSDIYTILNCPEPDFFLPDSVRHCIVIRAAVFDENDSCVSKVVTNSYFIKALGCDTHGLPALSLCADSLDLFDFERGIFVPGIHYDPLDPYATGNYFMRGREWERLSNIEFYEFGDNAGINQQVGLRTHGKQSRWRSQKGYTLYAREEYGKKRIKYKFFETTPIQSFKRLALKPYLSSWNGCGCKDYICNRIAQPLNMETLSSRPGVLFINGEYWGVYYVEEKPDEHYLEDHLDVDKESINMIKEWLFTDCGSPDNFNALYAWMEQADLSDETQYAYAATKIDIANFIDYCVFELFSENLDWPANNVRCWQEGNGKWRWIFYDGDGCLEEQGMDVFANATYEGDALWPTSRKATLFFRRLLENEQFKEQFANRFMQLVFTNFSYQSTKPYFDYIKETLMPEVPNQIERFNYPNSFSVWENYCMPVIDWFLRERPERIIEELNTFLSVDEAVTVAFRCYPNPFKDEIRVGIGAGQSCADEISIYDMLGRKVFSESCHPMVGESSLVVRPNLPTGLYVLRVGGHSQLIVRY